MQYNSGRVLHEMGANPLNTYYQVRGHRDESDYGVVVVDFT